MSINRFVSGFLPPLDMGEHGWNPRKGVPVLALSEGFKKVSRVARPEGFEPPSF
jgi:hypothetical protein